MDKWIILKGQIDNQLKILEALEQHGVGSPYSRGVIDGLATVKELMEVMDGTLKEDPLFKGSEK